ncbi:DUF2127 domain-containing protein [Vibrio sp. RC27]
MKGKQEYKGVKAVALFAMARAALAFLACYGIYVLAGQNIPELIYDIAETINISRENQHVTKLAHKAEMITPGNLQVVIALVFLYGLIRIVEAYGLWNQYLWTEWFSFISGSIYIPFELYECVTSPSILSYVVLAINLTIVGYLYWVIKTRKKKKLLAANEYVTEQ